MYKALLFSIVAIINWFCLPAMLHAAHWTVGSSGYNFTTIQAANDDTVVSAKGVMTSERKTGIYFIRSGSEMVKIFVVKK